MNERLTYKRGKGILVENNIEYGTLTNVCYQDCVDKLGQLEDVEQELGIDLVKLLNAKKVYYMGWNRSADVLEIKETHKLFINLTNRTIEYYENEYSEFTFDLELKNYGKNDIYGGWALTKEELE